MSLMAHKTFRDFRVIDIPLGTGLAVHPLYIKEHSGKAESNGRTLFVGNIDYVPGLTNERMNAFLTRVFEQFGEIETISISNFHNHHLQKSRFALLTFQKKAFMKSALTASEQMYVDIGKSVAKDFGISEHFQVKRTSEILEMQKLEIVDLELLKEEVFSYLQRFDENEEVAKLEQKRKANVVDEDGFIQVVSRNKKSREQQDEFQRNSGNARYRKKAEEGKELKNFYRHQIREEKRNQLEELRERFEEDKKKVASLKAARKFKPF